MNTRELFDRIESDLSDDQRLLQVFRTYIERSERNRSEFLGRVQDIITGGEDVSQNLAGRVLDEIRSKMHARDFDA